MGQVAGVLSNAAWSGGPRDPIVLQLFVSAENAGRLRSAKPPTVNFTFVVYQYDGENKEYFTGFRRQGANSLTGVINCPGGRDCRFTVGPPAKMAPNLELYPVYIEVLPWPPPPVGMIVGSTSKTSAIRNWGVEIGSAGMNAP